MDTKGIRVHVLRGESAAVHPTLHFRIGGHGVQENHLLSSGSVQLIARGILYDGSIGPEKVCIYSSLLAGAAVLVKDSTEQSSLLLAQGLRSDVSAVTQNFTEEYQHCT